MGFTNRVDAFYITAIFCLSTCAHSAIFFYFFSCAVGNKRIWGKADSGRLWFSFLERGKDGKITHGTTRGPRQGRARRRKKIRCSLAAPSGRANCLDLAIWSGIVNGGFTFGPNFVAAARGLMAGPSAIATCRPHTAALHCTAAMQQASSTRSSTLADAGDKGCSLVLDLCR